MAGPTAEFFSSLDVANRACQLLGVPRIASFTEDSKQAAEIAAVIDKVRRAELQRNLWRFSIRTAALRPIDTTVLEYVPAAWSSTATYLTGSIVSYNNQTWQASTNVAANQQPDISPASWDYYPGSMTATAWSATLGSTNAPALWSSTTVYNTGDPTQGGDGFVYDSVTSNNVGNNPTTDNGVHWLKIGPVSASGGYFAGELVYTQSGNTINVFVSLSNGNTDNPSSIQAWNGTTYYNKNDTAVQSSVTYQSLIDLNLNNTPVAAWASGTTYAIGNQVLGTDNHLYTSRTNGNIGHNPANAGDPTDWTDNGAAQWEAIPAGEPQTMAGQHWLQLDGTLASIRLVYPIGSGPRNQSITLNVFQLPNGFLKMAPQDPKSGSASYLGSPGNLMIRDWRLQGNYLLSRDTVVVILRFQSDVSNVPSMTAMFCEGWACRVAAAVCEAVTQSTTKLNMIGQEYKAFMGEARLSNAIELSSDEPPLDDWIACRI